MNETLRRLPFEGCFNFRDLGGWQTDDGRAVRWGQLFRADSVHLMTDADCVRAKEEVGLRLLLDLRNDVEIELAGIGRLAEGGLVRHSLPLSSRRKDPIDAPRAAASSDRSPATLAANYLATLEASNDLIVEAVETLASEDGLPAVFFCAAGKDRTGVLSAVVLGALGVRDEDIVEDYVLTADAIAPIIERLAAIPGAPAMYRDFPVTHFTPYAETMELVLEGIHETYGSFASYLRAQGITDTTLRTLEERLLEPAPG